MARAPQLNSEQRQVLSTILRVGRRVGASRKDMIAAVETGLVESDLTNPAGGDGTSQGWRQETASSYPGVNRRNVGAAARRFFNEARSMEGQYGRPGALAAAVQRPAAQYRGRYAQAGGQARQLLAAYGGGQGGGGVGGAPGLSSYTQTTTTTPGVDNSAARLAELGSFLGQGGVRNSSALLQFASTYPTLKDTPARTSVRNSNFRYGSTAGGTQRFNVKAGVPVARLRSEGGQHPTEGLAGYPAHDFFAKAGSAAVAPVTGRVIRLSGHDPKQGPVEGPHGPLGWSVYIKGNDGRTYYLTHMGSRSVKPGQRVRQGQKIGTVANYDRYGTPSHIHMGVSG